MGILDNHKKKEYRFKKGDLIIYNPTEEQRQEIVTILEENQITLDGDNARGNLDIRSFRWLMRNVTSIGSEIDELSDEELIKKLDESDRDLLLFIRELGTIVDEIIEDLHYETYEFISTLSKAIDIMNSKDSEANVKTKIDKLLKKKKVGLTFEEIISLKDNPEELKNKLNKKKKK